MKKIKSFFKNKEFIAITSAYFITRIILFITYWNASSAKGGWQNFFAYAQPPKMVFKKLYHDYCDWHSPLYYTFTSMTLDIFKSHIAIYFFQLAFGLAVIFLIYKIANIFFSKRISFWAAFLVSIEPLFAWHFFMLSSENLFIPLFLAGFYFFFQYIHNANRKKLIYSAIIFGIATLVRTTSMFLPFFLAILVLLIFFINKRKQYIFSLADYNIFNLKTSEILKQIAVFLTVFILVLAPWVARNKMIYGFYTVSNVIMTNPIIANIPLHVAYVNNISFKDAVKRVHTAAINDIGNNVWDQGDCKLYSRDELITQFTYFKEKTKEYVFANFFSYMKFHTIKSIAFYFQSGYETMTSYYSFDYFQKPDVSSAILKGNFNELFLFIKQFNYKIAIYLFGIAFWGLLFFSVLFSLLYSAIKRKKEFIFFYFSAAVIFYIAMLTSPFSGARYKMPLLLFFFASFLYMINIGYKIINRRISKNDN